MLGLAGCRQDMHDQPRYRPLRASTFFADGRSARPLVAGTVPRGSLAADAAFYTGMAGNQPVNALPFPANRQVLERGRERFNIYCAPCHSETGEGEGIIVRRGYLKPPSLHIDRLREAPLGHFFAVITHGFGGMPDYSAQIVPEDRWKIVAYIRALQLSQGASVADVPESERGKLGQPPPPLQEQPTQTTGPAAPARPAMEERKTQSGAPERGTTPVAPPPVEEKKK